MIVVPSSVLDNWDSELEKFCPVLEVVKYHGSQKNRAAIRQNLGRVASGADRQGMPVRGEDYRVQKLRTDNSRLFHDVDFSRGLNRCSSTISSQLVLPDAEP